MIHESIRVLEVIGRGDMDDLGVTAGDENRRGRDLGYARDGLLIFGIGLDHRGQESEQSPFRGSVLVDVEGLDLGLLDIGKEGVLARGASRAAILGQEEQSGIAPFEAAREQL